MKKKNLKTIKLSPEAHQKLRVAVALAGKVSFSDYLEEVLPEVTATQ